MRCRIPRGIFDNGVDQSLYPSLKERHKKAKRQVETLFVELTLLGRAAAADARGGSTFPRPNCPNLPQIVGRKQDSRHHRYE